jgi:hypothetical protein
MSNSLDHKGSEGRPRQEAGIFISNLELYAVLPNYLPLIANGYEYKTNTD